jgi:8-oxo-dGTP pyrophosphatase MutT (NUDIX family)
MGYILELRELVGKRPLFSPGATVVAFDHDNRVLMQLRSDTQTWGFPGGSSELGDSLEDTARRELFEETGLVADRLEFITVLSGAMYHFTYPNGDQIFNVGAVFVARGLTGDLQADVESLELRWFAPSEIPLELAGPITQWVVDHLETLRE